MEKGENRSKFFKEFPSFVESIELNKILVKCLGEHPYFRQYNEAFKKLSEDKEKITFILLVMTRERSSCKALIICLEHSGQMAVAERLRLLNTSEGPIELSTDIEINVAKVTAPIMDQSNCYNLVKRPRGKCIIINNVEEQLTPDVYNTKGEVIYKPLGLERETKRYVHIFTELYFEVKVLKKLNAIKMKEELNKISKDIHLKKDEAFVLIVVSHGQNEQVLGYDACEALRKERFGEIRENDLLEIEQELQKDVLGIKEITEIFSEAKCPNLSLKPKLFIFTCCRVKDDNSESLKPKNINESEFVKVNKPKTHRESLDTFVCYACSEGFESFYSLDWGMSYFGQALTHSIAQYACDEPLSGLMSRTSTRLRKIYSDMSEGDKRYHALKLPIGSFAIEVITYAMDRQVYFNPGFEYNVIVLTNTSDNTIISMEQPLILGASDLRSICSDNQTIYCLTKEGLIYFCDAQNSYDAKKNIYQHVQLLESDAKFDHLYKMEMKNQRCYSMFVAVSENNVYYLKLNQIIQTDYKYLLNQCSVNCTSNELTQISNSGNDQIKDTVINSIETIEPDDPVEEDIQFNNQEFIKIALKGVGGFSKVYESKRDMDKFSYAIKEIKIKEIQSMEKIMQEVSILMKCDEDFVVKYYGSWIDNELFMIQMELLFADFDSLILEKPQFFKRVTPDKMNAIEYFISCELFKELLECVQYLHESKPPIIHRDLKPKNILIHEYSKNKRFLKLCDFGIATYDTNYEETISHTRGPGTAVYIAPEVLKGIFGRMDRSYYTTKADIYSLNIISQKLFDFDFNITNDHITTEAELAIPTKKLEDKIIEMSNTQYHKRPNCSEILSIYNEWSIKFENIGSDQYSDLFSRKEIKLNNFFVNFFMDKKNN